MAENTNEYRFKNSTRNAMTAAITQISLSLNSAYPLPLPMRFIHLLQKMIMMRSLRYCHSSRKYTEQSEQ